MPRFPSLALAAALAVSSSASAQPQFPPVLWFPSKIPKVSKLHELLCRNGTHRPEQLYATLNQAGYQATTRKQVSLKGQVFIVSLWQKSENEEAEVIHLLSGETCVYLFVPEM